MSTLDDNINSLKVKLRNAIEIIDSFPSKKYMENIVSIGAENAYKLLSKGFFDPIVIKKIIDCNINNRGYILLDIIEI